MRKNYLIFLIVIGLITLSVYSTYAMFTASIDTGDIVNLSSATLSTETKIVEYERLTINSGETKSVSFTVTNSTGSSLYYGVWYEMIKPTSITDGIQVAKSPNTPNDTMGSLTSGGSSEVLLIIENTTNSSMIVNIGVGYSETNSLDLPTDRYLITEEYVEPVTERTSEEMIEHLGLTSLVKTGTPDFSAIATTDEGIYAAEDDLGLSYYFRGASERNYVYFAEHYWRIVRINGDGTIRMIYDGTSKHENGESSEDRHIGTTVYNEGYNDNAYVGYMYGTAGSSTYEETHANVNSSTIKGVLDSWYASNIDGTEYEQYVTDAIYCNDRQLGSSGTGIGTTLTYYAAYNRVVVSSPSPALKCSQPNDRFTQSTDLGNGALATTYPIGLITIDEVIMAGGRGVANSQFYLYTGQHFWTMSPGTVGTSSRILYVDDNGIMQNNTVNFMSIGARLVVSLKSDTLFEGNGTYETPFEIDA